MKFFFYKFAFNTLAVYTVFGGRLGRGKDNIEFHSTTKNEQFSSLIVRKSGDKISFVNDDL